MSSRLRRILTVLTLTVSATIAIGSATIPSASAMQYCPRTFGAAFGYVPGYYPTGSSPVWLYPKGDLPAQWCMADTSGQHFAIWQSDGNLVVYSNIGHQHATWSSGTAGRGKYFDLQSDGNMVIYGVSGGRRVAIWNSHTNSSCRNCEWDLKMQTDGNLVDYSGSTAVWNSHTSRT